MHAEYVHTLQLPQSDHLYVRLHMKVLLIFVGESVNKMNEI
jgi:hypothetical protein